MYSYLNLKNSERMQKSIKSSKVMDMKYMKDQKLRPKMQKKKEFVNLEVRKSTTKTGLCL